MMMRLVLSISFHTHDSVLKKVGVGVHSLPPPRHLPILSLPSLFHLLVLPNPAGGFADWEHLCSHSKSAGGSDRLTHSFWRILVSLCINSVHICI